LNRRVLKLIGCEKKKTKTGDARWDSDGKILNPQRRVPI